MREYHLVFTQYEFVTSIILVVIAIIAIFAIRRFVVKKENASVFIVVVIVLTIVFTLSPIRTKMDRQAEEDHITSIYDEIYEEGYSDGYEEGYSEGYRDGANE